MVRQVPVPLTFPVNFSFEEFHSGGNEEVIAHLKACAAGTGDSPIYLWGVEGIGKTHLLQAVCQEAHRLGLSVSYLPMTLLQGYGAEVLMGLEHHQLVCVDDLHLVCGAPDWERMLFNLFNDLRESGGRMLISSRFPLADLDVNLPDLKTRLGWGLTLKLKHLSESDTLAALTLHAQRFGLELEPQVGRFLMSRHRRDLTSLRQLLEELDRATLAAKRKLTIPFLKTYWGESSS